MRSTLRKAGYAALLAFTLSSSLAPGAQARRYPPGPGGAFPDTLDIVNIQSATAVPTLAATDTVYGIGGIITGFDAKSSGYAFYIQASGGAQNTGLDIFTGSFNKAAAPYSLAIGDSVVCYGRVQVFQGEAELEGYDGVQGTDDCIVRRVSSGNSLPPFFLGSTTQLRERPTNTTAEAYEGMLVRIHQSGPNTLKVARTVGLGTNAFLLVDSAAPGDSVFIDGNTLATFPAPGLGTSVTDVQGIVNQRTRGYRIQLRDGNDIVTVSPPTVTDAYPIADDRIRVVFDAEVDFTSATDAVNYTLSSFGTVSSVVMDGGSAVILSISSGLPHGASETVTVSGVIGQESNLPITVPQARSYVHGVLSCAEVQLPNPDSLAATPCLDRSRFAGPLGQASQGGLGLRCTVRGVAVARYGTLDYIADASGGFRSGLTAFGVPLVLTPGHDYVFVGQVQEFFGETQLAGIVSVLDQGPSSAPAPAIPSLGVIDHDGCDVLQATDDAEDYEGRLMRVDHARVVLAEGLVTPPANGFHIANVAGTDTMLVSNLNNVMSPFAAPTLGATVRVTGILHYSSGSFRLCPRGGEDVEELFALAYVLHVTMEGEGTVQSSSPSDTVAAGSTVTLTAVPASGHRFMSWSGDVVSTVNPLVVTMVADRHLIARFEPLPGPDLAVTSPADWPAAVVPSSTALGGATPTAPAELFGDSLGTFVTLAMQASNVPALATWGATFGVDGIPGDVLSLDPDPVLGSPWYSLRDSGPHRVSGGWHTLRGVADPDNHLTELDEANNAAESQWLWRPRMISRGVDYLRDMPPDMGTGPRPNCDAVGFVRDPRYAWVVATAVDGPYDRYALSVCDDYSGATQGLSHKLAESQWEVGEADFVVGSSANSPSLLYAVMTRTPVKFQEGRPHHVQYWDSRGAFSDVGTGVWSDRQLAAGQLVQVYELYFEDLSPRYLALRCIGYGGLAFQVFDQAIAGKHSCGARGTSLNTSAGYDSLVYVPQRIGWHSVVLYRTGLSRPPIQYTFLSQSHPVLAVDGAPPSRLELSLPGPNPAEAGTSLTLALPTSASVEVAVYDVTGRRVRELCDGVLAAGRHELPWDGLGERGSRVPPGLYLVQVRVGDWRQMRRVVVR